MNKPICDFVSEYNKSETLRMHMPGHKGKDILGMEHFDITEIKGADSLYEADGIIAESEANASQIFGCRTLYSTEGSSQCIRAMLYLICLYARSQGKKPIVAAARNAHKTFLTAVGMLDIDVDWLYPQNAVSYLSCNITANEVEEYLKNADVKPSALYLTSPDYLGVIADIKNIAEVCHRYGVLLAVDNAHGAYLKFLAKSLHPIDLGADICCDSAHKTLTVLTGGAYLHLSDFMQNTLGSQAKNAMMLFGSTSPSYLVLQSLDAANGYMVDYSERLQRLLPEIEKFKCRLTEYGYCLYGDEPLKFTICAKKYGYTGEQLADILRNYKIEPEFADHDYLVLMLSAELDSEKFAYLEQILCQIPLKELIDAEVPSFATGKSVMSVRDAMFSCSETIPVDECIGRVLAVPTVGCPPAVPILVCGEEIDEHAVKCFKYYGIEKCCVIK